MKIVATVALAAMLASTAYAADTANPLTDSESWQAIRTDVAGDKQIGDAGDLFEVEAPYRASHAAAVPVTIRQTDPSAHITGATVVIDENPSPVAAEFTFGEAMLPLDLEMRVRVNQYSNVRVLADTDTGTYMGGRFVKASGGCSAPATRDPEEALASMGEMRLRLFGKDETGAMSMPRREAQVMIRHPNYSGLQRNQITHLFIAAHFLDEIEVFQGEELLFRMTGGISISENPVFRFSYADNGTEALTVRAHDTDGNWFEEVLPKDQQS